MGIPVALVYPLLSAKQIIFEPRIVDFDSKLSGIHRQNLDVTDEISDVYPTDRFVRSLLSPPPRQHWKSGGEIRAASGVFFF